MIWEHYHSQVHQAQEVVLINLKDIVPNAYTPVYEATDATDSGLIDASGNNQTGQWGYDITVGNAALSASYNPEPAEDNKKLKLVLLLFTVA